MTGITGVQLADRVARRDPPDNVRAWAARVGPDQVATLICDAAFCDAVTWLPGANTVRQVRTEAARVAGWTHRGNITDRLEYDWCGRCSRNRAALGARPATRGGTPWPD